MNSTSSGSGGDVAARLNSSIDCAELALRLGMKQPGGRGNFKSPHREDAMPSVAMYPASGGKNSRFWDFTDQVGGGPIDLKIWHSGEDFVTAMKALAGMYGVKLERPERSGGGAPVRAEQSLVEYIADNCLKAASTEAGRADVLNYLEGRGIGRKVIENALARRTLGSFVKVFVLAQ